MSANPFADFAAPLGAQGAAAPPPGPKCHPLDAVQSLDAATWETMARFYDHPDQRPRGATTFVPALDAHFKWMPGYANLWTGWPGSGKSEFVRQLLLLQAVFAEKKSLLFVPEDMPKEAFYDALVHSLTGQNPDPQAPNALPRRYYQRAAEFLREYVFVVVCPKHYGKTPGHILDVFEAARAKHGVCHFVLDPWNKCDHSGLQAAGGFQPYLVKELGAFTDWVVEAQTCLSLVAHPKGQLRPRGEARAVPDSDGVSGGQTWDDMMHCINAIYRPHVHTQRNDPAVAFYSHKIKSHRRMGAKPGSIGDGSENADVRIDFQWQTARYFFNGVSPLNDPLAQSIYCDAGTEAQPAPAPPASANPFPHGLRTAAGPAPFPSPAADVTGPNP